LLSTELLDVLVLRLVLLALPPLSTGVVVTVSGAGGAWK